jgi:hypothetical protein
VSHVKQQLVLKPDGLPKPQLDHHLFAQRSAASWYIELVVNN